MNLVKIKNKTKQTINNTIERHPVPVLGIDYKVKIIYKNIKITELDVENKTIKISLPNRYKKISNKEILDLAAHLAAYFSKGKHSALVPVDYTLKKHVHKPNGAKPGRVIYENQKTIYITPDEEAIEQLIKQF